MGGFERRADVSPDLALDEPPRDRRDPRWRPAPGKVTRTIRLAHDFAAARVRRDALSDAPVEAERDPTAGLMPDISRGGGRRMPAHIEEALSAALGRDLSGVRIHDDAGAATAARSINARAFAIGDDLFFGANQYDPESTDGLRLLAHEVAHTAQDRGSGPVELSHPHDADEQAAHEFADRFVSLPKPAKEPAKEPAQAPSRLHGPHDFPMIRTVTPGPIAGASGTRVRRWGWGLGPSGPTFSSDPITIFGKKSKSKTFDIVKPTYVPLISGMVVVDGLPVTYRAGADASVTAGADAWAGPAGMSSIVVSPGPTHVRGRNAAYDAALLSGPIAANAARKYYDIVNSPYKATGQLHFDAGVSAHLDASAGFSAEVAAADMLAVGGFARLKGGAKGSSVVSLDAVMGFDWWALGHASLSTDLTATWNTTITFDLAAEAGIYVELRPPTVPLLDSLYNGVRSIPGLSWVMPEFTALKWRREWKRRFPIYNKTQTWQITREMSIHGHTLHGVTVGGEPETKDLLDAAQKGISAATGQTPIEDIPKEEKDNRPKPDVSGQRAAATAQIKSTKRTVAREKKWNKEMLDVARTQAAAKAKAASAGGGGNPAPSLSIPAGGKDPVAQLEQRDQELDGVNEAAGQLEGQVHKLEPEEKNENSEHRRAAGAGYDAIAKSADKAGDAVDKGEGVFEKPLLSDDKENEKKFNALLADYMQRLDPLYDVVTTESDWAREMLEDTAGIVEVSAFREKVLTRHNSARIANFSLERIGPSIDAHRKRGLRGDYAGALAALQGMEHEIASVEGRVQALEAGRPTIPWDEDYVLPDSGQLLLLHPYRKGTTVREKFYGDYYDAKTRQAMDASLYRIKDVNGEEYWYYPHAPSGNAGKTFPPGALRPGETGDNYWLVYHDKQMPTRAHNHPPVVQHWNTTGRATGQAARVAFYNGRGPGTQPLTWEPKSINSSKSGGKNPDGSMARYKFDVSVTFRGK